MISEGDKQIILGQLERLTPSQLLRVKETILAYGAPRRFWRAPGSDLVSESVLEGFGDRLATHHATSGQPLSKDRFEFALERALQDSGVAASLVKSRTNRGHDIDIAGVPTSLKTEAAANIREDVVHVSKWMELGKGDWQLPLLLKLFLEHMASYERIYTLRCFKRGADTFKYELVEIPKNLLLKAASCDLEICEDSKQNPKPGYGYVRDQDGRLLYSLYFDGGSERKLQIKNLKKELCTVHATWEFGPGLEN